MTPRMPHRARQQSRPPCSVVAPLAVMTTLAACWLPVITLAACWLPDPVSASTAHNDAALQHFRALNPQDKLTAHGLLAEWQALHRLTAADQQQAAAGGSSHDAHAALAQQHLQRTQQRLQELLPLPQSTDINMLEALQAHVSEALATSCSLQGQLAPLSSSTPSRLARALTLVNIAWFCGCVLVVLAAVHLVGVYLAALVLLVPAVVWEAIGYLASLALLRASLHCREATAPYVALTGLMLLTACVGGSIALHGLSTSERRVTALMAGFALIYGIMAVRLQASLLGTLTVWWAVSALGFSIMVFPFLTVIGFRGGMTYPFAASLALVLAFLPFKIAPQALPTPAALQPFQTGVWLWCTLVLNVANLIMAHRKWGGGLAHLPPDVLAQIPLRMRMSIFLRNLAWHMLRQLPAVAVIGGTLACGILLDIEPCRAVGSVFGFLWFLSKLAELDWSKVGFSWAALVLGSVLWGLAYAVHTWPHLFMLRPMAIL